MNHPDHVTVHQYFLIHATVLDINVYMNTMMNIFDLLLFDATVSFVRLRKSQFYIISYLHDVLSADHVTILFFSVLKTMYA